MADYRELRQPDRRLPLPAVRKGNIMSEKDDLIEQVHHIPTIRQHKPWCIAIPEHVGPCYPYTDPKETPDAA